MKNKNNSKLRVVAMSHYGKVFDWTYVPRRHFSETLSDVWLSRYVIRRFEDACRLCYGDHLHFFVDTPETVERSVGDLCEENFLPMDRVSVWNRDNGMPYCE